MREDIRKYFTLGYRMMMEEYSCCFSAKGDDLKQKSYPFNKNKGTKYELDLYAGQNPTPRKRWNVIQNRYFNRNDPNLSSQVIRVPLKSGRVGVKKIYPDRIGGNQYWIEKD